MTKHSPDARRAPGPGEIAFATPLGRPLCATLDHRRARTRAAVVVLFGALPVAVHPAVFPGCWGRAYPLCGQCWHQTRLLVERSAVEDGQV